jgi:hypothetical protein
MEGKSPGRFLFGVCGDMDSKQHSLPGWILSPPASGDIPDLLGFDDRAVDGFQFYQLFNAGLGMIPAMGPSDFICLDPQNHQSVNQPADLSIPIPLIWRGLGGTKYLSKPFLGE